MLLFAHLGLALAAARLFRSSSPVMSMVALGALLPDIVDKPLGYITFGTFMAGRIYTHTLLFLLALILLAFATRSRNISWLAGGVFSHLFLDQIWKSPVIFLWPLLGDFSIEQGVGFVEYVSLLLKGLGDPAILVPEAFGLLYVLYLASGQRIGGFYKKSSLTEGHDL